MAEISKIQPFGSSTQYDLSALKIYTTDTAPTSSTQTFYVAFVNSNTNGYQDLCMHKTLTFWEDPESSKNCALVIGNGSGSYAGELDIMSSTKKQAAIKPAALTGNRTYTLPDATGTLAIFPSGGTTGSFLRGDTTWSNTCIGTIYAENLWASANSTNSNEHQVGVGGKAGQLYMYSQGTTSGTRGLYSNNSSGSSKAIIQIQSNNEIIYNTGTVVSPLWINNGNPDGNSRGHGLVLYHDSEGGNISIYSGNCGTYGSYEWQIDAYNGDLRFFHWNASGTVYTGVYIEKTKCVLHGACWNDYAEFRSTCVEAKPGQCVIENGDDTLSLSTKRCQPGAQIVSDTYGFAIGQVSDKYETPLAVSGRVLAYTDVDRYKFKPGQAVCSGPNGTVSRMRWYEKILWPERMIGIVSAIPEYEEWGNKNAEVKVDGRIWIKVK